MNEPQLALGQMRGRILQLQVEGKITDESLKLIEGDMEKVERELEIEAKEYEQGFQSLRSSLESIDVGFMIQEKVQSYEVTINLLGKENSLLKEAIEKHEKGIQDTQVVTQGPVI